VPVPGGTTVNLDGRKVSVKGKLGELSLDVHPRISVLQEEDGIAVKRGSDVKEDRALHGLTRALIANMIHGVSQGYTKTLAIVGIGYRVEVKGDKLVLSVGYSQPVEFPIPKDVKIEADPKKLIITVSGIDKQKVGQVSADIRSIRPPDPYKGKGIRYADEKVKVKEGKSGV